MRAVGVAAAVLTAASLAACASTGLRPRVSPAYLGRAHAHNDYEHDRPLQDGLDDGFTSVEADVWLVDGELLVAHDLEDVQPGRTLESLYLDPLAERAAARVDASTGDTTASSSCSSTSRARRVRRTPPCTRHSPSTSRS